MADQQTAEEYLATVRALWEREDGDDLEARAIYDRILGPDGHLVPVPCDCGEDYCTGWVLGLRQHQIPTPVEEVPDVADTS